MGHPLRISEASNLAIHAMAYLAKADKSKKFSAVQIAEDIGVSASHLSKVMQRLVRSGYASSIRGAKGGFYLGADPKSISLLQIVEEIDGKISAGACMLGHRICGGDSCMMGELFGKVEDLVKSHLGTMTLHDFSLNPDLMEKISGLEKETVG